LTLATNLEYELENAIISDWSFPRWSQFLFEPWREKVAHGGRGSSKSWTFARALISEADDHYERILCAREIQKSIEESVHRLLSEQIAAMGLSDVFDIQQRSIKHLITGSEFIFEGLRHNVNKIKSLEGLTKVWVEEAEKVSANSWEVLLPTIRKKGSQLYVTYNPDQEDDPTSKMYHKDSPHRSPFAKIVEVNYDDNPWFNETELPALMEYAYKVDPDAAAHVWGGKFRKASKAQILYGKYVVDSFTPKPGWLGPFFGADWGFAQDPTTLVKCWYDPATRDLYIEHEAYGLGVETQLIGKLFKSVPGSLLMANVDGKLVPAPQQHVIRADNSRPETITYVCHYGFNVVGVEKWSGSVEDGIAWLRSCNRIVIHSRCHHAEEEARLYKYKIDPLTGDVLPIVIDKHNHIWDAVRYAMAPAIRQTQEAVFEVQAQIVPIAADLDGMDDYDLTRALFGYVPSNW
jgi:phage terminase large subunit